MQNNSSFLYNIFLLIGDFLALVCAFVGAYILRVTLDERPLIEQVSSETYLAIFLTLLPFWLIIFAALGLYNRTIHERRFHEAWLLLVGSFIGLLFVIGFDYASDQAVFPARLVPLYGFGLAYIFLLLFRNAARSLRIKLFVKRVGLTNILVVGSNNFTDDIVAGLKHSQQSGYNIVALVGDRRRLRKHEPLPIYASFDEAIEDTDRMQLHGIVQTELFADTQVNNRILAYAQTHHIAYRFVPGNAEIFSGKLEVELFRNEVPVIAVHQTPLLGWGRIAKRLFDFVVSTVLLVMLSPVFMLIAIAIKLEDRGSVFFRQVRLTRFDREFTVFKFRTNNPAYSGLSPEEAFTKMERPDLLKEFRRNGNFLANDPRNTRVGNFLRKTSLDELAQLINVFRGDISLVGPRALVPADLKHVGKRHTILSVKSGITGLAQVSGRNHLPQEERRRLDVYYVQNWSFWLDITIMLKTFRAVLSREDG